jgi:phosphatidate cytidylyltransferase
MRRRLLTALALAVVGLPAVLLGGTFLFVVLGVFVVGAAWEYVRLFNGVNSKPQPSLVVGGVALILALRTFLPGAALPAMAALVLVALAVHALDYERGRNQAALDFGATLGGLVYLGWIGAYLFELRNLPEGGWWFMLVMPSVWLADSGAYSIGAAYGRHKMAPRLSPGKSWEGYAAGVFTGGVAGAFLAWAYGAYGALGGDITLLQGAALGLLLGALTPAGDLAESMFKRQSGLKDSSGVFPGHGGFFDRIDSWLWAGVIGFYFLMWFVL